MIRPFERHDVRRLKANEYSLPVDVVDVFSDPMYYKQTLVGDDSAVYCIIVFWPYWGNNWMAFFLVSQDIKPIHLRELKLFIEQAAEDLGAKRIQTESEDVDMINRMHEFLGFENEGTRKKMIMDKDYNMWGRLWDGQQ